VCLITFDKFLTNVKLFHVYIKIHNTTSDIGHKSAISNILVMEIGSTDVGSGEYILVSCAHSNTSFFQKVIFIILLKARYFLFKSTTWVIIRHRVKILFSVISSSITLEWQKWKSSKMKGILLSSPVSCWYNFKTFGETLRVYWFHHVRPSVCRQILCRTITWVVFLRIF
jgi:hypothetical protein